jgi:4-cresol dehydrogenase (hydroxylating)
MPDSVEEVQAILRIANEYRIPLWTSSQGRNNGYGGAAPRVSGAVVLSLRRMNRVLEVNEESATALIEPGVRFFDLYDHLRATGSKLWMSVPDLGWGSVVGNTSITDLATPPSAITPPRNAAWKWCCRTVTFSAPAWAA